MADRRSRSRSRSRDRDDGGRDGGASAAAGGAGNGGAGNAGKLSGTVVSWREQRGFGFIKPADGGEDVFCHRTAITDGEALNEGSTVYYEMSTDDRSGKTRAANVSGGCDKPKAEGYAAAADPGGEKGTGKETGTVKRWNNDRGFGFIGPDAGGDDIFCHHSAITDGNALEEGSKVRYDAGEDERNGKARASNLTGGCTMPRDMGGDRFGGGGYGGGGGGGCEF